MQATIKIPQIVNITHVHVFCSPRSWEDATVNGVEDTNGELIPLRKEGFWNIVIDIETGIIRDWPQGTTAKVHYKVCYQGMFSLLTDDPYRIESNVDCVPRIFNLYDNFDSDYLVLEIDGNGKIQNWPTTPNISDFIE